MIRFTIMGTPQEILSRLEAVNEVANRRKNDGWPLFQQDEEWTYETQEDSRVCDVCLGFAGRFFGVDILSLFGAYKTWGKAHVKPGTHITYPRTWSTAPDAYGGCRCNLYWHDYFYVLTERLWREMEMAAI